MSNILTNPNRYLLNVPEFQNVITSATGTTSNFGLSQLQAAIDTTTHTIKTNTIATYNNSNIVVRNHLFLSNSYIYYNGLPMITSNGVNSHYALTFNVSNIEMARLTAAGYLGVGTRTPVAHLDIHGNAVIRKGNLHISTSGAAGAVGNVYADGTMYASGFLTPSDPVLKTNVQPLVRTGSSLPTPVEFTWIASGRRDIGFLANEVQALESTCVSADAGGRLHVDYSKLVTLCVAELRALRSRVGVLEAALTKESPVTPA